MKHVAFAALLLVLIPMQAAALDTNELLGLVAMPLAVAAASEVTGVPASELAQLVATLNRANVPPTQVVQVVRYAPAAIVVETEQPAFVTYVEHEVDRGIVGPQLVTSIDQRLRTYDVIPQFVTLTEPAPAFVLSDQYIPPAVVSRVAEVRPIAVQPMVRDVDDLLALIAMPLAVNAVAEIAGVTASELSTLVATLNNANVAPVQVVEVLRYVPVALVADQQPEFVQFVQTQVAEGVYGPQLVRVIEQRLQTYDVTPQIALAQPSRIVTVDENFFPPVVRTRIADARHPHGGPPGQLKKQVGVQTGAEIVHGQPPPVSRVTESVRGSERRGEKRTRVADRPKSSEVGRGGPRVDPPGQRKKSERSVNAPASQPGPPPHAKGHGRGQSRNQPPGQSRGQGQGQGKGKGKGKG